MLSVVTLLSNFHLFVLTIQCTFKAKCCQHLKHSELMVFFLVIVTCKGTPVAYCYLPTCCYFSFNQYEYWDQYFITCNLMC